MLANLPKTAGVLMLVSPAGDRYEIAQTNNLYKRGSKAWCALRAGEFTDETVQTAFTMQPEGWAFDFQDGTASDAAQQADEQADTDMPLAAELVAADMKMNQLVQAGSFPANCYGSSAFASKADYMAAVAGARGDKDALNQIRADWYGWPTVEGYLKSVERKKARVA